MSLLGAHGDLVATTTSAGYRVAVTADSPYFFFPANSTPVENSGSESASVAMQSGGSWPALGAALAHGDTGCLALATSGGYITCTISKAAPVLFAMECCIQIRSSLSSGYYICAWGDEVANIDRQWLITQGRLLRLRMWTSAGEVILAAPTAFVVGQIYHVVARLSGTSAADSVASLWINGVKVAEVNCYNSATYTATRIWLAGARYAPSGYATTPGPINMSNWAFYTALSDARIAAHYAAFTG